MISFDKFFFSDKKYENCYQKKDSRAKLFI